MFFFTTRRRHTISLCDWSSDVCSSDLRRQVTINGRTVNLGGRYGDATLVRISDEEIVLRKGDATEVIKLYSSVNRRRRHWPAAQEQTETAEQREKGTHEAN